jgi:hypothetical protein
MASRSLNITHWLFMACAVAPIQLAGCADSTDSADRPDPVETEQEQLVITTDVENDVLAKIEYPLNGGSIAFLGDDDGISTLVLEPIGASNLVHKVDALSGLPPTEAFEILTGQKAPEPLVAHEDLTAKLGAFAHGEPRLEVSPPPSRIGDGEIGR